MLFDELGKILDVSGDGSSCKGRVGSNFVNNPGDSFIGASLLGNIVKLHIRVSPKIQRINDISLPLVFVRGDCSGILRSQDTFFSEQESYGNSTREIQQQ